MSGDAERCTCCGRKLRAGTTVWLELDQRTWTYHREGGVPDDKSQGCFPFGPLCAARHEVAHAAKAQS